MARKEKPSFEDDLARLQEIVELLEEGPDTLDEMLALFEEGVGVTKRLEKRLAEAETRVERLIGEGDASTFAPEAETDEE